MGFNIPQTDKKRVVIVGAGFAGLSLAKRLAKRSDLQVVLIDKNNYHQFQPLFYQVAMAGLDPASISFPLRKLFQRAKNVHIRVTEVKRVDPVAKEVETDLGSLRYDMLVVAIGADTNFFGNETMARNAIPMKSVGEALFLRNELLSDLEKAVTTADYAVRQGMLDMVIVGGGPTGVELAGALAEMKKYVLPKDYPELDLKELDIHLVTSPDVLLKGMSAASSKAAQDFLEDLGVNVHTGMRVTGFDGTLVEMKDGSTIQSSKVIWAAGITGNTIEGLPEDALVRGNRIAVDRMNRVNGFDDLLAIGDIAYMEEGDAFPEGHPQVAQVALQQGRHLAENISELLRLDGAGEPFPFTYKDKGSMATIGRNKAVVDLPSRSFNGFFAWLVWLVVHLFALIGVKNKIIVFLNWCWSYLTYDQHLRLIIRPYRKPDDESARNTKE